MSDIEQDLKEIKPLGYSKDLIRRVTYDRVSGEALSKRKLQKMWKLSNAQKRPAILEDNSYVYFQYEKKPVIIIRKHNGKLYSLEEPDRSTRHQAFIILSILDGYGLVDNYRRETVYVKGKNLWSKQNIQRA